MLPSPVRRPSRFLNILTQMPTTASAAATLSNSNNNNNNNSSNQNYEIDNKDNNGNGNIYHLPLGFPYYSTNTDANSWLRDVEKTARVVGLGFEHLPQATVAKIHQDVLPQGPTLDTAQSPPQTVSSPRTTWEEFKSQFLHSYGSSSSGDNDGRTTKPLQQQRDEYRKRLNAVRYQPGMLPSQFYAAFDHASAELVRRDWMDEEERIARFKEQCPPHMREKIEDLDNLTWDTLPKVFKSRDEFGHSVFINANFSTPSSNLPSTHRPVDPLTYIKTKTRTKTKTLTASRSTSIDSIFHLLAAIAARNSAEKSIMTLTNQLNQRAK
ncbi:hypothetical protein BGZ94_008122 [Podila epigama]|nr:hypothetical protein BGZ94_008122 [Podila epigama]